MLVDQVLAGGNGRLQQACLTCILHLTYPRGTLSVPQNKLVMLQSVNEREGKNPHIYQLGFKLQYLNVYEAFGV